MEENRKNEKNPSKKKKTLFCQVSFGEKML